MRGSTENHDPVPREVSEYGEQRSDMDRRDEARFRRLPTECPSGKDGIAATADRQ